MDDGELFYVTVCYHCANKTQMLQISHFERLEHKDYKDCFITFSTQWDIYLCPVCDEITLIRTTKNPEEPVLQDTELVHTETILYPNVSLDQSGIPPTVKKSFEAALRIKNIEGTLCAIGIRRTLEMMCKDKNASGKTLYLKLKDLSDKGTLPPIVNEMASILRDLGNEAAHGDEREFSEELIESMIKFTHVILDYVYNLPDKLSDIQKQISKTVNISIVTETSSSFDTSMEVDRPTDA